MQGRPLGSFRRLVATALAGSLLCFCGCLQEKTNGDVQTFAYPIWIPVMIFLAGGSAAGLGYVLLRTHEKAAYMLLLLGPVTALFVAPSYFFHYTSVGPEELRARYGIWGLGGVRAKYSELAEIKFTFTRSRRSTNHFLDCKTHEGKLISLSLQVEGIEAAAPRFLQFARAKHIAIVDHQGDPLMLEAGP